MMAFCASSKVLKINVPASFLLSESSATSINFEATNIPKSEPIGLKACAQFKRWVAVRSSPIDRMNGLAVVSKKANPNVKI